MDMSFVNFRDFLSHHPWEYPKTIWSEKAICQPILTRKMREAIIFTRPRCVVSGVVQLRRSLLAAKRLWRKAFRDGAYRQRRLRHIRCSIRLTSDEIQNDHRSGERVPSLSCMFDVFCICNLCKCLCASKPVSRRRKRIIPVRDKNSICI